MSFKCSVFGHRYGDPEVTREREEQGSEVVITIEETETCKRCGETRIVSENKEVTTLETPSDIVGDDIAEEGEAAADNATDPSGTEASPAASTAEEPATEEPTPSAEGDDAELIDEAEDEADGPGMEGPSLGPDAGTADASEEPATGVEEADADEDDAVILDDEDDSEEDFEREPGEWPDEAEDEEEDDEWAPSTDTELRPVEDEQPDVEPTSSAVTVPEGTFRCPECDFTTEVESSSLRAGDFCPECHRGALTHEPEE